MPNIRQSINNATQSGLAKGQYGDINERQKELRDHILDKVAEDGFSEADIEKELGRSVEEHADQAVLEVWPDDGTRND